MAQSSYTFTGKNVRPLTIPALSGENETLGLDGSSTAGWTLSNISAATDGNILTFTHTATAVGTATRTVTAPNAGKDWLCYLRARMEQGANEEGFSLRLYNNANPASATREVQLIVNRQPSGTPANGNAYIRYRDGGGDVDSAAILTGLDTTNDWQDWVLHMDQEEATLGLYYKASETVGGGSGTEVVTKWHLAGRIQMVATFDPASIRVLFYGTTSAVSEIIEIDHLYLCAPNMMIMGDSIAEGQELFSRTLSDGLNDFTNTLMHHTPIYMGDVINSFIVSKGVGGDTSAEILARVTQITGNTPQLVFLEASQNDYFNDGMGPVAYATRTTNIQDTVDAIVAAGANVVLWNCNYCAHYRTDQPARRDYFQDWWEQYAHTLTDVDEIIDINLVLTNYDWYTYAQWMSATGNHLVQDAYYSLGRWILSGAS